jgi:hypothetical protein
VDKKSPTAFGPDSSKVLIEITLLQCYSNYAWEHGILAFFLSKEEHMKRSVLSIAGILFLLLAACGPSPEQIATMTASAWTPTPKPTATATATFTPTPFPYDLTVSVVDEANTPIAGASISSPGSGNGEAVTADAEGKYSWTNLPGAGVTLDVTAQGYLPAQQTATLERGPSEISIVLKRDPYGLLPTMACAPGEALHYLDDFQDGEAQGWLGDQNDKSGSRFIGPAPDVEANSVLTFDATKLTPGPDAWLGSGYDAGGASFFGDVVWRMHFMVNRSTGPSFNWQEAGPSEFGGQEVTGTRYSFNFAGSPWNTIRLLRTIFGATNPLSDINPVVGTFTQIPEKWHWMEISSFQGHIQMWIDGKQEVEYQDQQPLPPGRIGIFIGPFTEASTTVLYFDNMTVCVLSAPFTSIPAPVPVP